MAKKMETIKIKGKDYVTVAERVRYLHEEVKDYSIDTEYTYFSERKMWVVKAKLTIGENTYTGLAQEIEVTDEKKVNFSSALENAETSAVGRACAMAGIGIVHGIASADEVHKATNRSESTAKTSYVKQIKERAYNQGAKNVQEAEEAISFAIDHHIKLEELTEENAKEYLFTIRK